MKQYLVFSCTVTYQLAKPNCHHISHSQAKQHWDNAELSQNAVIPGRTKPNCGQASQAKAKMQSHQQEPDKAATQAKLWRGQPGPSQTAVTPVRTRLKQTQSSILCSYSADFWRATRVSVHYTAEDDHWNIWHWLSAVCRWHLFAQQGQSQTAVTSARTKQNWSHTSQDQAKQKSHQPGPSQTAVISAKTKSNCYRAKSTCSQTSPDQLICSQTSRTKSNCGKAS